MQAYLEPTVDKREDKFTWGQLDITILRDYTKAKFGWSQSKLDEIINPVIKRLNEQKNQRTIQDYFKRKVDFQCLEDQMSKRVKAAVQKMDPNLNVEDQSDDDSTTKKANSKKQNTIRDKLKQKKVRKTPGQSTHSDVQSKLKRKNSTNIPRATSTEDVNSSYFDIKIPKLDRHQEIIPQRERDKEHVLKNKLKAIEIFRKTKIDKKHNKIKRKVIQPKDDAELSESDTD